MIFWFTVLIMPGLIFLARRPDLVAEALDARPAIVSGSCVVVTAGLGGYLYFVESKRDPADAEKKEKVFTVEADKIDELTVKSESGERTTLKKTRHRLADRGARRRADRQRRRCRASTRNLSTLEIQRVIDENPPDLAEYGLTQPRIEVTFKAAGKEQQAADRPQDAAGERPLREDRRSEAGVPDSRLRRHDLQQDDLRSARQNGPQGRTATRSTRSSITSPKRVLQFAKADGEWKMAQPVKARADFTTVDGLVSRLTTLQTKSIAAPQATALGEYGLDKPAATIQLGSGSSQATLAHRQERRGRRRLRARISRSRRRHDRIDPGRRAQQGHRRVSAEGSLRRPRLQCDAPRSDAQRPDRRRSRRPRRRTRKARTKRSGSRRRRRRKTSTRPRSTT